MIIEDMPYADILKIAATLLAVILPTVVAIFAFRAAERKIVNTPKVVTYERVMWQLADAAEELVEISKRKQERDYEWQQSVVMELREIVRAMRQGNS